MTRDSSSTKIMSTEVTILNRCTNSMQASKTLLFFVVNNIAINDNLYLLSLFLFLLLYLRLELRLKLMQIQIFSTSKSNIRFRSCKW